jgi:hypothetical protein
MRLGLQKTSIINQSGTETMASVSVSLLYLLASTIKPNNNTIVGVAMMTMHQNQL